MNLTNNNEHIRLSIVIPMWNTERYIERCVSSCYRQGLAEDEFEILIANDGSSDGSVDVVKRLQSEHINISLYSQENAGAGMARNLGLKHATGRYVMFVDSDDYLNPNTLKPILELAEEKDLDVCRYDMECITLDTGVHKIEGYPVPTGRIYTGDELLGNAAVPFGSACSSLYKRSFLKENGLCFSGQSSSEDVVFVFNLFPYAQKIMYINICAYTYEIRTGSRDHSIDLESRKRYMLNNVRNAALVKETALKNELISGTTRASLIKRANSMMAGEMLNQLSNRRHVTRRSIKELLALAEKLGVYPIKGGTLSVKTTIITWLLLNDKRLFITLFRRR